MQCLRRGSEYHTGTGAPSVRPVPDVILRPRPSSGHHGLLAAVDEGRCHALHAYPDNPSGNAHAPSTSVKGAANHAVSSRSITRHDIRITALEKKRTHDLCSHIYVKYMHMLRLCMNSSA